MWINGVWCSFLDENVDGGDLGGGDGGDPTPPADPAPTTEPAAVAPATPAVDAQGDWPADWRQKISSDEKHSKTLERFASPKSIYDSYMSLRQKLDSGELKPNVAFPDKGTPEQQAAWRKDHGIPDKAEDYNLAFGDGLVFGEADKPFVDEFLQVAHQTNATPDQVNKMLSWYHESQERAYAEQEEKDAAYLSESEDTLRAEWGPEYRTNVNMIRGLVDTLPESVRELFMSSRLADGTAMLNHPDMARWLVSTARAVNPVATVVPGAGANMAGAIDDEITSIEKVMRTDRKTYNNDEKMQARLRELYAARERAKV